MKARESVRVERSPFGSSSFSLCTAEFDLDGSVTIRIIETNAVMDTLAAGTWRSVKGFGAGGLELYHVTPQDIANRRTALTKHNDESAAAACGPVERRI